MKASSIVTGSITPLRVTPWNSEQCAGANSWKAVLRTWWLHQCLNISSITLSCDTLTLAVAPPPPLPVSLRDDSDRIRDDYKSLNLFFLRSFFSLAVVISYYNTSYICRGCTVCVVMVKIPRHKCLPFLVATGLMTPIAGDFGEVRWENPPEQNLQPPKFQNPRSFTVPLCYTQKWSFWWRTSPGRVEGRGWGKIEIENVLFFISCPLTIVESFDLQKKIEN